MKKLFLLIILALGVVLAEPVVGNAYVISALGIKNSSDNVAYVSGDTSVNGNANYVLAPQVIIYQEGLSYVGSYTPFTGCLNSQHYTNGTPDGMCITGIVNDLSTGGIDKALSAEQGKILNDKITNIQSITRINYLRQTLHTTTLNGITFTNNGDGTYTLNGTASATTIFDGIINISTKNAKRLVGCPSGGSNSTYKLDVRTEEKNYVQDYGDGANIDYDGYLNRFRIVVYSGYTCDNLVFKPMLTDDLDATYDDFIPYQDSLATNQTVIDATRTNLLSRTIPTQSKNGITITNNGDGTYTINGTATTMTSFIFQENLNVVPNATYKLVGSPRGKSIILAALAPDSDYALDFGDGGFLTTDQSYIKVYVQVNEGVVCDNVVVKPMLTTDLDATYDDFISFDNSIVTGINSGIKMDLLWENSNPTSRFSPQTIELNLSKYQNIVIRFYLDIHCTQLSTLYWLNKTEKETRIATVYDQLGVGRSIKSITDNGVSFGSGMLTFFSNGSYGEEDNQMIPYQIYGVR